jgi:hypothetical protein
MAELLISLVVMLVFFFLASTACGRELRSEGTDRPHRKKAA